ncbi:hypothetical protein F4604DRAFT_1690005 [Suillus subluteus]|nr:hypothetical protein F4604DRAFT_1690005 [Suillus subluteus]
MDINNKNDYPKMVKNIISEKLKKVNIFINMKNVKKLPVSTHKASLEDSVIPWLTKKQSSSGNAASHKSGESKDKETMLVTKTSALELKHKIACYQQLIIKKWGNDYDKTLLSMVKNWACAMFEILPITKTMLQFLQYLCLQSKFTHFFKAMVYECSLYSIGAGSDIFAKIADQGFAHIGLIPGDIIHLKKESVTWWNDLLTKNELIDSMKSKCSDTSDSEIHENKSQQLSSNSGSSNQSLIPASVLDSNIDIRVQFKLNIPKSLYLLFKAKQFQVLD